MKITWQSSALVIAGILLALTFVTAYALDEGWSTAGSASDWENLSNSGDIRQPALALGENHMSVIWSEIGDTAIPDSQKGIFHAVGTSAPLSVTSSLTLTGEEDTWSPVAAYANDELQVAWVQGDYSDPQSPIGRLLQKDVTAGTSSKVLMDPVYGHSAPRLVTGPTGDHLLIASAETQGTFSQADLYHMHRPTASASWLTPTMVITHAQAQPPSGGIWYPHAALSDDAQTMYVVWEQTNRFYSHSVWFMHGTWEDSEQSFSWGSLERLSAYGQKAVRPKVIVDSEGRSHVTWVEDSGGQQYINYRRFENATWYPALDQPAVRLDDQPVQVNSYRPTWSTISMATAGNTVCVAWHGYRAPLGESGNEEIYLNCSKNGGTTWSDVITNVSETPERLSLFPNMAIDTEGTLHIAWEEHLGGSNYKTNYDVYYRNGTLPEVQKIIYLPLTLRSAQ